MKLAFDEEVGNDAIDLFRKTLSKRRHPQDISGYFAFAGQLLVPATPLVTKDKNTTLKGFTKKAIIYTAKKAGLKPKPSKRQKYVLRGWPGGGGNNVGGTLPAIGSKSQIGVTTTSPLKHSPPSRDKLDGDDDVSCEFIFACVYYLTASAISLKKFSFFSLSLSFYLASLLSLLV
jgi:hypothetical protein